MAVAAAGREGSLEPAAGAGVGQGIQMWGLPCPAGPLLRGGILTVAVPGEIWGLPESELGTLSPLRPRGGHCSSLPLCLGAILGGGPWKETRNRSGSHNGSGSEILRRLRIIQAELGGWVNGEQGEGSGFVQGRWAAWV